jgi:type I restriction enzyme S subunit
MTAISKTSIPTGWRRGVLSEYVAKKTKGIVPNKTPDARFELYSVPSHEAGRPEIVSGSDIGSNKQIVDVGTVLLCKINPRINRSWVVSSHTDHQKIASTEWISFPPSGDFEPKYLAYYLNQESVRSFLAANASGVGGSLTRVKPATIKDYPYPIAPVEQQRKIVAEIEKQFSRLDEAVSSLKRVKANLKRYKAAVLKAAVEGKLTEEWRTQSPAVEPASKLLERILAERRAIWEETELAKMKAKGKEPKNDRWTAKYKV